MPVLAIRQDRDEAVIALCDEFPKAFFLDGRQRVPLKIGIEKDIDGYLKKNRDSILLDYDCVEAVQWYQTHVGYLKECSRAGCSRVDLNGKIVGTVTPAEARAAADAAAEAFAEIEARKARIAARIPVPQMAVVAKPTLPLNSKLTTTEMLAELEKQLSLVKLILGESPEDPLRGQLARPALRLMADELSALIARIDNCS